MVEIETKRRIWWHMVASDWLLSNVGGPNEGTYMFHPRQFETYHPSNVDDDDIPTGTTHFTEESYNLPLNTKPTSMTYFLYRIQVATLSREVVDLLPLSFFVTPGTECSDEIYNNVILLDRKYQQFLKSLPPFFQLNIRVDYRALIKQRPYLEWQRYLINFITHAALARLHCPFLVRGSTQHKFAYSRMQCIRSAETVLEIRNLATGDQSIGGFTFVVGHFLLAAIILATDVCFNPDERRISQRKQDVWQACRALEEKLNAKLPTPNDPENKSFSSNKLMLNSIQNAIQHILGLLRKRISKDKQQQPDIALSDGRTNGLPTKDTSTVLERERQIAIQPVTNSSPRDQFQTVGSSRVDEFNSPGRPNQGQRRDEDQAPFSPPPSYNEPNHQLEETSGSGDLLVDELWGEFFSVGPTFNDEDWDTFLADLDEQIVAMD